MPRRTTAAIIAVLAISLSTPTIAHADYNQSRTYEVAWPDTPLHPATITDHFTLNGRLHVSLQRISLYIPTILVIPACCTTTTRFTDTHGGVVDCSAPPDVPAVCKGHLDQGPITVTFTANDGPQDSYLFIEWEGS